MLEINNAVGSLENVFRMGRVSKGNHTRKYRFTYVENGSNHNCFMTYSSGISGHSGNISMGTIKFGWNNDSWSFTDYLIDKEYFKIFINMIKCVEKEFEIKLPETLFK